jgi:Mg-chelatase subunit ChlD
VSYTFRTTPPATYISPTAEEMKEKAKQVGLGSFSRDLVADLCNLAAGGRVNSPSQYREVVREGVESKLAAPNSDGEWELGNGDYTKDRYQVVENKTSKLMKYHQNVCDFLQSTDLTRFPGQSPLEQAMSLLKMLSTQQGGSGGGEGGEPFPIFQDSNDCHPEGTAADLHEAIDSVDQLSDEELDMLDPDGEAHSVDTEQDGQRSGDKGLNALKIAERLMPGQDEKLILEISRTLDQFTKMQVRKQREQKRDPAGEEVRNRPIEHLGELGRIKQTAWAMRQKASTYFLYQAVTHQFDVRERVTTIEKKQSIFILLDGSGSMSGKKHLKATGVVMNRLKAVIDNNAEVFLSVFDTSLSRVEHAATPEEARALIKKFRKRNFSGGGTDIAAAVRAAHKYIEERIKEGAALYRPEIVVLTDEDTSVSGLKKTEIPGTRVHGFAMSVANPGLVAFAKSTGGIGVDKF